MTQIEKAKQILAEVKANKTGKFLLGGPGFLQTFADGDDKEGKDENKDKNDDTDDEKKKDDDPGSEDKGGKDKKDDKGGKSFSQEDVNAIAAKEAKKATEKILKQLGVTDFKSAKEGLDKYKEILDGQKTDAQKAAEKAQGLEKTNGELQGQVKTLTAQVAVLKAGVNPDSIEDVVVLANNLVSDDVDMDKAVLQVLKKYPHFKAAAAKDEEDKKDDKKPKFSQGDHKPGEKPSEVEQWKNAFKF